MDNSIVEPTAESLAAEKAAVEMLLAMAQVQVPVAQKPAEPKPEPAEVDLYSLVEAVEEFAIRLKALKTQESELLAKLASVCDERQKVERGSEGLKAKLFEALYGKERPTPVEQPQQPAPAPRAPAAPRKLNNEIVIDRSVPIVATTGAVPAEAHAVATIPSLQL